MISPEINNIKLNGFGRHLKMKNLKKTSDEDVQE